MLNQYCDCSNSIDNEISLFKGLTKADKEFLKNSHTCARYKKGEMIYKEGQKPEGLLSLTQGKVKIFKEGVGHREQIIRMAKPVGFIGFRALFADDTYTSSAVAIEESVVCTISKDCIFSLLKSNQELGIAFIKFLSDELGFANNRLVTLTQKHIRGRLAESLLFLKETYGYAEDNQTISVFLSREDIANLSNMTTSNAIRTLSTFANEQVISISGRKIRILDLKRLEKISEMG